MPAYCGLSWKSLIFDRPYLASAVEPARCTPKPAAASSVGTTTAWRSASAGFSRYSFGTNLPDTRTAPPSRGASVIERIRLRERLGAL